MFVSIVRQSYRISVNRIWRRMLIRCCSALILMWLCRRAITNDKVNVLVTGSFCDVLPHYNATQVDVGRAFFNHLIHENDSFKDVNEHNICSLIHFFIREAVHNRRPVRFSSGMFVLYDSTEQFFTQLMMAKNAQYYSNENRSGYIRRLQYFALDLIISIFRMISRQKSAAQLPFIYVRGDESSHFHERGDKHERYYLYPAYGMDIKHGCMPNKFSHILFGKLSSLSNNTNYHYRGDRIYIKPEQFGLQQFQHYLAHSHHYIQAVIKSFLCRWIDRIRLKPDFCKSEGTFHEWTDQRLIKRWTQLLTTINTLTWSERHQMKDQAFSEGIREIYRQTLLFPLISQVNDFRLELEHRYGRDVSSRKGHEIIFTTEQLLNSSPACLESFVNMKRQCQTTCTSSLFS